MAIGLLQTDSVLPHLQVVHGDYPAMFRQVLEQTGLSFEMSVFDVEHGCYPADLDECDGYVITGSRMSVYDDEPWIKELGSFVQELDKQQKKLVGICFGHQLVAHVLGGKTQASNKGWGVGCHNSRLLTTVAKNLPGVDEFSLLSSHKDQVSELPPNADLIASNAFCEIAAMRIEDHILTFQGHPEFTPAYSKALLDMRRELLGEETYRRGVQSLQQSLDRVTVAAWMIRFIEGNL
ncbi:MAG: GMP synthase [Gammaproteobacteria bacterium]|nr:GMP synthase [Gammaproteobacteria bacterium]MBT5203976.1 GMP synthase [Gammaproteobacteria bacterium]MBT5600808.1 GMP synthase [Gammaproteobacteria bacterium]MBT6244553.1 GMP synthase [Gammaproteobacteria bacterium]